MKCVALNGQDIDSKMCEMIQSGCVNDVDNLVCVSCENFIPFIMFMIGDK